MSSLAVAHFDRRIAELEAARREAAGELPLEVFDRSLMGSSFLFSIACARLGLAFAHALAAATPTLRRRSR